MVEIPSAEDIRKIQENSSDDITKKQLKKAVEKIQNAALKGKDGVTINTSLNTFAIKKLEEMGYTVFVRYSVYYPTGVSTHIMW